MIPVFERLRSGLQVIVAVLVVALPASVVAQELDVPAGDGWYSWQVATSESGSRSCCYGWHTGQASSRRTCDLDGRGGGYSIGGDCDLDSADLRIYVRMRDGRPDRVRALSAGCPVTTDTEIADLGAVDTEASVRWLAGRITGGTDRDAGLLAAIAMHAGDAPLDTLTGLLEDRERPMKLREQALFWLAQSDSDEAFEYLDRLLTRR